MLTFLGDHGCRQRLRVSNCPRTCARGRRCWARRGPPRGSSGAAARRGAPARHRTACTYARSAPATESESCATEHVAPRTQTESSLPTSESSYRSPTPPTYALAMDAVHCRQNESFDFVYARHDPFALVAYDLCLSFHAFLWEESNLAEARRLLLHDCRVTFPNFHCGMSFCSHYRSDVPQTIFVSLVVFVPARSAGSRLRPRARGTSALHLTAGKASRVVDCASLTTIRRRSRRARAGGGGR